MAYVAPHTWAPGDKPTAAQFNQEIRDNVAFLANPPACRVFHNAAQSINNATETTLAFNSERYDTAAMHDTVTNNSRITFPLAGIYVVTLDLVFDGNGTGTRQCLIRLNGTTFIAAIAYPTPAVAFGGHMHLATQWKFAVSDYVEARVHQTSGGALNVAVAGNYSPEFSATWIGLG